MNNRHRSNTPSRGSTTHNRQSNRPQTHHDPSQPRRSHAGDPTRQQNRHAIGSETHTGRGETHNAGLFNNEIIMGIQARTSESGRSGEARYQPTLPSEIVGPTFCHTASANSAAIYNYAPHPTGNTHSYTDIPTRRGSEAFPYGSHLSVVGQRADLLGFPAQRSPASCPHESGPDTGVHPYDSMQQNLATYQYGHPSARSIPQVSHTGNLYYNTGTNDVPYRQPPVVGVTPMTPSPSDPISYYPPTSPFDDNRLYANYILNSSRPKTPSPEYDDRLGWVGDRPDGRPRSHALSKEGRNLAPQPPSSLQEAENAMGELQANPFRIQRRRRSETSMSHTTITSRGSYKSGQVIPDPLPCQFCDHAAVGGKPQDQKTNLERYVREIHRNKPRYSCPSCGRNFTRKHAVKRHQEEKRCRKA